MKYHTGAILGVVKGKFGGVGKAAMVVGAIVAIALLKTFDAKFWGVVVMGGAVIILFFLPEGGGYFLEFNNFIEANPLKTPPHIAPVWYFTPFYSMLRATTDLMVNILAVILAIAGVLGIVKGGFGGLGKTVLAIAAIVAVVLLKTFDAKFWGVVVMGLAVMILFPLPWFDRSPVKSIRYRPRWNVWLYGIFVINFAVLGYLGIKPPSVIGTFISQAGTLFYFGFFLLMPWWSRMGEFKPVPARVTFQQH